MSDRFQWNTAACVLILASSRVDRDMVAALRDHAQIGSTDIMKPGVELLADTPGSGSPVERHGWYDVRLQMWLSRGDPVRWTKPWGAGGSRPSDRAIVSAHTTPGVKA
jgi:hypothetical protein